MLQDTSQDMQTYNICIARQMEITGKFDGQGAAEAFGYQLAGLLLTGAGDGWHTSVNVLPAADTVTVARADLELVLSDDPSAGEAARQRLLGCLARR